VCGGFVAVAFAAFRCVPLTSFPSPCLANCPLRNVATRRGLTDNREGDLGPVYGFQWRHFGAEYKGCDEDHTGEGVDQLAGVIEEIRTNPNSRRIIMSAWNPVDIPKMALPPCHVMSQFFVANGELSCLMYQRSADMGLGVPFNIASYALLTHLIAHVCGLKPGEFIHSIGDAHIYQNHIEPVREQLEREPFEFPTLKINSQISAIGDFTAADIELENYKCHPPIKMDMAV
jgi:thymidylate synthase